MLAARWIGLDPAAGRYLLLGTTGLSVLGYEHNLSQPIIRLWNDDHHVAKEISTEDIYKVYAGSFKGQAHLNAISEEA